MVFNTVFLIWTQIGHISRLQPLSRHVTAHCGCTTALIHTRAHTHTHPRLTHTEPLVLSAEEAAARGAEMFKKTRKRWSEGSLMSPVSLRPAAAAEHTLANCLPPLIEAPQHFCCMEGGGEHSHTGAFHRCLICTDRTAKSLKRSSVSCCSN